MSNHNGNANKMVGEDHLPDTGKMVSDTPRTDARVKRMIDNGQSPEGLEHWARNLERELNAANDKIKRLEEAGDKMAELIDGGVFMKYAVQWYEAKEDKP